jgi:hypothetical protein
MILDYDAFAAPINPLWDGLQGNQVKVFRNCPGSLGGADLAR